jgi:hypothetical protein
VSRERVWVVLRMRSGGRTVRCAVLDGWAADFSAGFFRVDLGRGGRTLIPEDRLFRSRAAAESHAALITLKEVL